MLMLIGVGTNGTGIRQLEGTAVTSLDPESFEAFDGSSLVEALRQQGEEIFKECYLEFLSSLD